MTLTLASLALVARFVRVCVAAALADPAARAGRARGEGPPAEIRRALRRSSAAFAAMGAALVPAVVSGSILVERVFSLPGSRRPPRGSGLRARPSDRSRSHAAARPPVVVAASLAADLVTAALDPRTVREDEAPCPGVGA